MFARDSTARKSIGRYVGRYALPTPPPQQWQLSTPAPTSPSLLSATPTLHCCFSLLVLRRYRKPSARSRVVKLRDRVVMYGPFAFQVMGRSLSRGLGRSCALIGAVAAVRHDYH